MKASQVRTSLLLPLLLIGQGCDHPFSSRGEMVPPEIWIYVPYYNGGVDWVRTNTGTAHIRGIASDSSGIVKMTYSYAGAPEQPIAIEPADTVRFMVDIRVRDGIHPLTLHAYDVHGNRANSPELEVRATSGDLQADVVMHRDGGEDDWSGAFLAHIRGTAPGMETARYTVMWAYGVSEIVVEGEIPLSDSPERAFDLYIDPQGHFPLDVVARDANGVELRWFTTVPYVMQPEVLIEPAAGRRVVPEGRTSLELAITASAVAEGDLVQGLQVGIGDGELEPITIAPARETTFRWAPEVPVGTSEAVVRIETVRGYVRIVRFEIERS